MTDDMSDDQPSLQSAPQLTASELVPLGGKEAAESYTKMLVDFADIAGEASEFMDKSAKRLC